jgi:hypothetical protein
MQTKAGQTMQGYTPAEDETLQRPHPNNYMTQTQNIQKQNYVDMDLNELTIRSARKDYDNSISETLGASNLHSKTTRQNVKTIISSLNPPTKLSNNF